jgi:hypothetical protein
MGFMVLRKYHKLSTEVINYGFVDPVEYFHNADEAESRKQANGAT